MASLFKRARVVRGGCLPAFSRSYRATPWRLQQASTPITEVTPAGRPAFLKSGTLPQKTVESMKSWASPPAPDAPSQSTISIPIDGQPIEFNTFFLRDACRCPRCLDHSSGQKQYGTADIPSNLQGKAQIQTGSDGHQSVRIEWENDYVPPSPSPEPHTTTFPLSYLAAVHARDEASHRSAPSPPRKTLWDASKIKKELPSISYTDYLTSAPAFATAIHALDRYGLLFLRDCPDSEHELPNIVNRIGPLRDTFYGPTWDVKSVPNAKNIAYTHHYLALHMDLLYMTNPPHLQFLHSLRARCPGGESMFSDAFHAAEILRREGPDMFEALATFPVTYHYRSSEQWYSYTRPTIELWGKESGSERDTNDSYTSSSHPKTNTDMLAAPIKCINWSPPFQAPFRTSVSGSRGDMSAYHAAAAAFDTLLNAPENLYEYRMREGDCVIFDNRRTLHARRAFDASTGERWLKGAYLDDDVFRSALRVAGAREEGWQDGLDYETWTDKSV
ncbi:Clavaminate synthase-like protein [Aulographum hederae CBS 113979]|uniref:Clavaminate synthase-like protein n=1 Tax=Aulographum hederae CBS 113979 TaxID=1176131 RepID=A0A6G1GZR1_9PEZI|nr:Clavaminate synthase-like protein [Aulographum hederae CBS 113979]